MKPSARSLTIESLQWHIPRAFWRAVYWRSAARTSSADTDSLSSALGRKSQVKRSNASTLPISSAATKPGTSAGRMPEKLSVSDRAIATAGLAKEVEAVNQ